MPKAKTPFQPKHALEFGLEVYSTNRHGNEIRVNLGRDEVVVEPGGSYKQKSRSDIKYYNASFAPQNYRNHNWGKHNEAWTEYQALSREDKDNFFKDKTSVVNTLHNYIDMTKDTIHFSLSSRIIDVIIGNIFFRDDEVLIDIDDDDDDADAAAAILKKAKTKAMEKTHAMKLFVKDPNDDQMYNVTINNAMWYELVMDHVSIEMSFRQVVAAIQHTKDRAKVAKLTGINDLIVGQYHITDLLDNDTVWAFSLACDGNTHRGQHILDVRIRICFRGVLLNLHLAAIPMFERHTTFNTFNLLMISMSTDGENTNTRHLNGLVMRFCREASNIDVIVKEKSDAICDGEWENMISALNVKCPKQMNRWVHLGRFLAPEISYAQSPSTHRLYRGAPPREVANGYVNRSLLMAQQEQLIDNLVASLCVMFNINLVHDVDARDNPDSDDDAVIHTLDQRQINAESIVAWVEDQGSFPCQCYERLSTIECEDVVRQIAEYMMGVVAGLSGVKAQRDGRNGPSNLEVPPVLPHQLAKLRHGFFVRYVFEPYRSHLSLHWPVEKINLVEAEHRDLIKLCKDDPVLRATIDKHDHKTMFDDVWDVLPSRFDHLRQLCGGLATVFPNMTSVESDFSILKWEMDANRNGLTHLSLEGIFQAKQQAILQAL
ncbi:hypothetical protein BDL97_08G136500 [Sphagnum fallax]|nr:hypothetical protein BDL97_08G136500 [Sphagnum fallax]